MGCQAPIKTASKCASLWKKEFGTESVKTLSTIQNFKLDKELSKVYGDTEKITNFIKECVIAFKEKN